MKIKNKKNLKNYTKEEISSAMTLISLMNSENECQTNDSGIDSNYIMNDDLSSIDTNSSNRRHKNSKRKHSESTGKVITNDCLTESYSTNSMTSQQMISNTDSNPLEAIYFCIYPNEELVYTQCYPMYAMIPTVCPIPSINQNIGPKHQKYLPMPQMIPNDQTLSSHRCPYCLAPKALIPTHSMTSLTAIDTEKTDKMSEPICSSPQNQMSIQSLQSKTYSKSYKKRNQNH